MKKRFLKLTALSLIMLLVLMAFASCTLQTEPGENGKSAYEIAVENGYTSYIEDEYNQIIIKEAVSKDRLSLSSDIQSEKRFPQ